MAEAPLPSPTDWAKPIPELAQVQALATATPVPSPPVLRVNQLDAGVLDGELMELLKMQLARVFSMCSQGFSERYKPEVEAGLRLLLWGYTVMAQVPTPGMRLQNLRLAWAVLAHAHRAYRVAWLLNCLAFLRGARYPTPLDRALRLRMVAAAAAATAAPRPINYAFLSRRLLWEHAAAAAAAAAPAARALRLPARAAAAARRLGVRAGGGRGGAGAGGGEGGCVECGALRARQPYVADCGHTFCYYCVRVGCEDDAEYGCPACGARFAAAAPLRSGSGGGGAEPPS
ncbi:hypothetical protein JKP88DRAFT_262634 [Tribonema minus]|uniref:RING-type E3 ubiquitin transferase (cysteine targeting) n=1 Tax=Tribonema minus TaxID=303371 RepID=A0A835Z8Z6_9STRA|nr:hypothetical protein JKP88DRAFT_262634 [Tribonema minus]